MADNVVLSLGTADGATIMTDQDASAPNAHAQMVKLVFGALNTFTLVSSGSGLPVNIVAASAVPVTDNSGSLTVDGALTSVDTITNPVTVNAHAVTNAGTFAVQADVTKINSVTPLMGAGNTGTGSLRVTIATDQAQLTNKWLVTPDANSTVDLNKIAGQAPSTSANGVLNVTAVPGTAGGWSVFNATSGDGATALTNSAQQLKASAGVLGGWYIYNPNAAAVFVPIYNVASASVTVGTTAAALVIGIPAGSAVNLEMANGIGFGTAISVAAATTATGAVAPTTALEANFFYK